MTHHERYKATHQAAEARRKAKRQAAAGILPMWKAVGIIDIAMRYHGATFAEAYEALTDIITERGLKIRADIRG